MIKLEEKGYCFNPETGIWLREGYQGLSYSDGDVSELRLAQIIREANDLSVLSSELSEHCTDWVSLYHLGTARGNILRPFEHCLSGRTLEIGAGCGAISRYLGECGGSVLSLEGSVRRAEIAASRTRDLPNVRVLAERFDEFETHERFDVITLIGVLEYASVFSREKHAALSLLQRAHDFLRPDGILLIAIENQLGLKYFAGAPEDHLSVPMYGIEGRYVKGQPQTFGRKKLETLIRQAGFKRTEFLYPAPDYKLPNSIITEHGFELAAFDAAALAWQSVKKDPQLPGVTGFNLERTWPVVIENGLGMELANSFLVAATGSDAAVVPADVLAYHYNTSRKPEYCKLTRFVKTPDGIDVQHEPLSSRTSVFVSDDFSHELSRIDTYVSGKPLIQRFLNIATTPNWTVQDFAQFIEHYLQVLRTLLSDQGLPLALQHASEKLPANFIDAVPHNILIGNDGVPTLIDIEWRISGGVELGHLLVRSLLLLIANATPFYPGIMPPTRRQFVLESLRSAGLIISDEDVHRYILREAQFQQFVTGRAASEFLDWKPDQPINQKVLAVQTPLHAKLYCSDADGIFREEVAIALPLTPGHQQLTFSLAGLSCSPKRLRLDPVDRQISFALDNVRLSGADGEVWAWDKRLGSLASTSGLMRVDKSGSPSFFLSLDDDPYLELPHDLPALEHYQALSLVMDLVLYTDEVMAHLISVELNSVNQYQQDLRSALTPLTEHIQTLTERLGAQDNVTRVLSRHVLDSERHTLEAIERLLLEHNKNDAQPQSAQVQQPLAEEQLLRQLHLKTAELESALLAQQIEKDTHIHHLNLQVSALQGGFSRKLSAPIRNTIMATRRMQRVWPLLPAMIRRGGGLNATVLRSITVLRQQGLSGLVARVRWFSGTDHGLAELPRDPAIPDRNDYAAWVERYDTLDAQARWQITEDIRSWKNIPLISIIMPVFDPPLDLLRAAIDSVRYQLYPNWELCIADDASSDPHVRQFLEQLQQDDPQIKVVFREHNGHISAASNSAIAIANGEFLALLDNDDLLSEHALYWVARTIIENPDVGLIYSDEDKVDIDGKRSAAYFKPDWNVFLFRSQNMVSHLGVYRRALVEQVGGFRTGFEGAQDYDLAMRCVEQLASSQIKHIPRVLYHWRAHAGSTALATDEKPYAFVAGVKALEQHLLRLGIDAETELLPISMYRVRYTLPAVQPLVSLIIPTRNAHSLVKQCIDSIRALTSYTRYELILVDNGSDDPAALAYFAELALDADVTVLRDDGPFNYSALNNRAVKQARGELIGLINNDIEIISPDWLEEMVAIALQPTVGAVGARLWFADQRLQHGGVILGVGGIANHAHKFLPKGEHGYFGRAALMQSLSAVTAACLIIRRSVYDEVGGLDEVHLKIAFNDVDFCLRIQDAGYSNVWTPFAEMYHHESATRGLEDTPEKQLRFSQEVAYMAERWPNIRNDPAYNPNLTLDHHDFGLAWPPRI